MIRYDEIKASTSGLNSTVAEALGLDVDDMRKVGATYGDRVSELVMQRGFDEAISAFFCLAYTAGFRKGLSAIELPVTNEKEAK